MSNLVLKTGYSKFIGPCLAVMYDFISAGIYLLGSNLHDINQKPIKLRI